VDLIRRFILFHHKRHPCEMGKAEVAAFLNHLAEDERAPAATQAYAHWIKRFIFFHGKRHPNDMGQAEINQFLTHLAVQEHVSASTQNQALNALPFLYKSVLQIDVGLIEGVVRAKRPERLPIVLTRQEVAAVLAQLDGVVLLVGILLYGTGLRLLDALRLRVKDVDFTKNEITIRDGKGQKDRVTMLPAAAKQFLLDHLKLVQQQHQEDLRQGHGRAPLPFALERKYPHADREWGWQYVFPAASYYLDRDTGLSHRHHLHESVIQKAVAAATRKSGITKHATPHTFRKARSYYRSSLRLCYWKGNSACLGSRLGSWRPLRTAATAV
jgi:integron integrase